MIISFLFWGNDIKIEPMFVFDIEAVTISPTSVTPAWMNTDPTTSNYTHTESEHQGRDNITVISPTASYTSFVTSETVTKTWADSTVANDVTGKMNNREWSWTAPFHPVS